MAWQLSGQLIEACSCNVMCPCWYGVPDVMVMDKGYCTGAFTLRVRQGNSDGVDLAGRSAVVATDFPGPTLFDGNATARIFIDEGASADQRRELESILLGQKGGPMGVFATLVSRWLPAQSASIQVNENGDDVTIRVGGAGEYDSRLLKDQDGNGFEVHGGGFIRGFGLEAGQVSVTASRWSDADMPRVETRSGVRGNFTWSG
jgi:hypothetical protein